MIFKANSLPLIAFFIIPMLLAYGSGRISGLFGVILKHPRKSELGYYLIQFLVRNLGGTLFIFRMVMWEFDFF